MRRRIDWKISFALFVLTPIVSLGTVPTGGVMRSPAVAQAPDTRTADAQPPDACKAKADELLQQGIAKFDVGHYEAAATPYQQALTIYQAILIKRVLVACLQNWG